MKKRILTKGIIDDFKHKLIMDERSDATIEKYCRDISAFFRYVKNSTITKETAIAYKNRLKDKGYAIRSINSMLASINSLFTFLGWYELKLKSLKIQRQIYCPEEKELTREEYNRLVITANNNGNRRLSLILQTICATGIRVSELEYITVEAVKSGRVTVNCKNKSRTIFIVRDLQKKLIQYCKSEDISGGKIFITKNGLPVNRCNIWKDMKNLCKQADVNPQKVFPHNLRHLFARLFYGIEKDIAKLADILGHSSINTTRIYIVSTGAEHLKLMENMRLIL